MTTSTPVRPAPTRPAARPGRRHWPFYLAAFLVLALLGGAGYVFYRTPVFGLQQLEVTTRTGDISGELSDAVRSAADLPDGTPLLTIDLAAVRARVQQVPQVSAAEVSRHWPNSLVITVTQRRAAAATMANGAMYLIDSTGYPYLKVSASQVPTGLLTLALATPRQGDPATLAALAVAGAVKAPVLAAVASVSARSAYDVELTLRDGRSVIWGSPDDGAKKMQILPAVLQQPGRVYDISDPDIVTVSR